MRQFRRLRSRGELQPIEVRVHGALLQGFDVRFRIGLFRDAARSFAPMVKDPRNMPHAHSGFAQAEHEFEVLHAIEH